MTCARKRASHGPKSTPFESNWMSAPVSVCPPFGLLKVVPWRYFERLCSELARPSAPDGRGAAWTMSGMTVALGGSGGVGGPGGLAEALGGGVATVRSDELPTDAGAALSGFGDFTTVALRRSRSDGTGACTGICDRS